MLNQLLLWPRQPQLLDCIQAKAASRPFTTVLSCVLTLRHPMALHDIHGVPDEYTHTYTHTNIHTYIQTNKQTNKHTYIHTYTCIYIYIYRLQMYKKYILLFIYLIMYLFISADPSCSGAAPVKTHCVVPCSAPEPPNPLGPPPPVRTFLPVHLGGSGACPNRRRSHCPYRPDLPPTQTVPRPFLLFPWKYVKGSSACPNPRRSHCAFLALTVPICILH